MYIIKYLYGLKKDDNKLINSWSQELGSIDIKKEKHNKNKK